MTPEEKKQMQELKDKVTKLESILIGLSNDTRLQANIRKTIIAGEHTAGKPTIVGANGKRYKLQTA